MLRRDWDRVLALKAFRWNTSWIPVLLPLFWRPSRWLHAARATDQQEIPSTSYCTNGCIAWWRAGRACGGEQPSFTFGSGIRSHTMLVWSYGVLYLDGRYFVGDTGTLALSRAGLQRGMQSNIAAYSKYPQLFVSHFGCGCTSKVSPRHSNVSDLLSVYMYMISSLTCMQKREIPLPSWRAYERSIYT